MATRPRCEFLDVTLEDLVGSRVLDRLNPDYGPDMVALYAGAVESGEDLVADEVAYRRGPAGDGLLRIDLRARKVGDALSCTWRDVTERSEAAARFAALAENAADVVILSKDGVLAVGVTVDHRRVRLGTRGVRRPARRLPGPPRRRGHHARFAAPPSTAAGPAGSASATSTRTAAWCGASHGGVRSSVPTARSRARWCPSGTYPRRSRWSRSARRPRPATDSWPSTCPTSSTWPIPTVTSPGCRRRSRASSVDPDELVGTPVSGIVSDDGLAARSDGRRAVFEEGRTFDRVEVRFRSRSGPRVWMSLRADPVLDGDGVVTAAVCSLRQCQDEVIERWAAATLSAGNALVAKATDEQALLAAMCETAAGRGGYRFAWYGRKVDAPGRPVVAVASSHIDHDYLDQLEVSWDDVPLGRGPTGRASAFGTHRDRGGPPGRRRVRAVGGARPRP